jgi:pimeloyl-ACP methyl ester carboxylesterase
MGGTAYIWRPIAAQLEDELICIALDQRGHGMSRPVPDSEPHYHALDYAKDVLQTVEDLGIEKFFLIGHSMGVRTALAVAHLEPKKIAGLIAVDIGITSDWGGGIGLPLATFLQNLPKTFLSRTELKDYVFKQCPDPAIAQYLTAVAKKVLTSEVDQIPDDGPVVLNAKEVISTTDPEVWIFPFDHEALVKTIYDANAAPLGEWVMQIVNAGVPATFLRGANSKVWSKVDYEAQRKEYVHPLLHFEEWENCGHGLPFEQRARFVEFIRNFVK